MGKKEIFDKLCLTYLNIHRNYYTVETESSVFHIVVSIFLFHCKVSNRVLYYPIKELWRPKKCWKYCLKKFLCTILQYIEWNFLFDISHSTIYENAKFLQRDFYLHDCFIVETKKLVRLPASFELHFRKVSYFSVFSSYSNFPR